jgi:UDP-2,4-diacetamido-2,4,6-trideoxy-beta-L-altropyranose hydrolase
VVRFRADATATIGVGHVMRTLTLAAAARARGHDVALHAAALPSQLVARARRDGIVVERVAARPGSVADAEELATHGADVLWTDGYDFDDAYMEALGRSDAMLAATDDGRERSLLGVALVVNPNPHAGDAMYADLVGTTVLTGLRFALVRGEVVELRRRRFTPARVRRVVVSLGGTDPGGLAAPLLESLLRDVPADIVVDVAIGLDNPRAGDIQCIAAGDPRRCRVIAPDGLAAALAGSDLAVLAAGSTLWEAAAVGVPVVSVIVADNQAGLLSWPGAAAWTEVCDARRRDDFDAAAAHVVALVDAAARRRAMSVLGKRLVDGRGATRVVATLERTVARRKVVRHG